MGDGSLTIDKTKSIELNITKDQEQVNATVNTVVQPATQVITGQQTADTQSTFKVVTEKDKVKQPEGPVPAGPEFIGMSSVFIRKQSDDNSKMLAIREALDAFHNPDEYRMTKLRAAENLVKACDKYCSFRFRIFQFGNAKKRLDEVIALRREAIAERDRLKDLDEEEIYRENDDSGFYEERKANLAGAGFFKKVVAGIGAIIGFFVVNPIKIVTLQPVWGEKFYWKPGNYYAEGINFMDRIFGRKKYYEKLIRHENGESELRTVSQRVKITKTFNFSKKRSSSYKAEEMQLKNAEKYYEEGTGKDEMSYDDIIDNGYDAYAGLINEKKKLIAEYKKKSDERDLRFIKRTEDLIEKLQADYDEFLAVKKGDISFDSTPLDNISRELNMLKGS